MKDESAKVLLNENIAKDVFRLRLQVTWKGCVAGQFVMLEPPSKETFLRRPFGIVCVENGELEICYKVVGRGTRSLTELTVGSRAKVMGPLGNGFSIPPDNSMTDAVIVAGGYGVGPMLCLAKQLSSRKVNLHFLYGARSKEDVAYASELSSMNLNLCISTEDGTLGARGLATDGLDAILKTAKAPQVFACGPAGLLKAVARKCDAAKVQCQISVEAYMACGIGVCLGCACKDKEGNFIRACREGPVFKISEIDYEALA